MNIRLMRTGAGPILDIRLFLRATVTLPGENHFIIALRRTFYLKTIEFEYIN